jgi:type IV secretory pathway VirB3-like protein
VSIVQIVQRNNLIMMILMEALYVILVILHKIASGIFQSGVILVRTCSRVQSTVFVMGIVYTGCI